MTTTGKTTTDHATRTLAAAVIGLGLATFGVTSSRAATQTVGNATWTTDYNGIMGGTQYDTSWAPDTYANGSPVDHTYAKGDGATIHVQDSYRGGNTGQTNIDPNGNSITSASSSLQLQSYNQSNGYGTLTLHLATPQEYFGAVLEDYVASTNAISFYSGATTLLTINTTTLGRMVSGSYGGEYAAFLNVAMANGATFDKIVMTTVGGAANGSLNEISVQNIQMSASLNASEATLASAAVPEPGAIATASLAGLLGIASLRRRRDRRQA